MKIGRELNIFLNNILNEAVPPYIRDRKWFGWMITKILYGENARHYMAFHERVWDMTDEEICDVYAQIHSTQIDRPTNLNAECIEQIRTHVTGETVLEVGCGNGYLCNILAANGRRVTACDFVKPDQWAEKYPEIPFVAASAEQLSLPDKSFDTVVSTHMLEHVRDFHAALSELRRVAAKRLIVVVPRERPHFYTPSLHLHFFPYRYSFLLAFRPPKGRFMLQNAGGDWFYYEDVA